MQIYHYAKLKNGDAVCQFFPERMKFAHILNVGVGLLTVQRSHTCA